MEKQEEKQEEKKSVVELLELPVMTEAQVDELMRCLHEILNGK
jgi:hypothetical protein